MCFDLVRLLLEVDVFLGVAGLEKVLPDSIAVVPLQENLAVFAAATAGAYTL